MKTPIQQAIDKLVERYNETSSEMQEAAYAIAIMDLRSLLPTEREVIEDAYNAGSKNIKDVKDVGKLFSLFDAEDQYVSASDYYTKTYNNGK